MYDIIKYQFYLFSSMLWHCKAHSNEVKIDSACSALFYQAVSLKSPVCQQKSTQLLSSSFSYCFCTTVLSIRGDRSLEVPHHTFLFAHLQSVHFFCSLPLHLLLLLFTVLLFFYFIFFTSHLQTVCRSIATKQFLSFGDQFF